MSFRKKSIATKNSSFSSARVTNWLSGSETFGLKQIEIRPLISPASILRNSSYASTPGPGRSCSSMPQTAAMYLRCSGFEMSRQPGQLIALLAVLAAALAVGLADDRAVAALRLADAAGREHEVDRAERVLHAVGVVLDAARVEQEARLRGAPQLGGLAERALGHAGDLRGARERPLLAVLGDRVEADGVRVDELAIDPAVLDHQVRARRRTARRRGPGRTGRNRSQVRAIGVMRGS